MGGGGTAVVLAARLEFTVPRNLMEATIPDERGEFTLPRLPDFGVPE